MNANTVFFFAVGIGIVAGLRAMTAPAVVSWAAHLGWLNLQGSPLAFMGSVVAAVIFTLGAIAEYVSDRITQTPNRTTPGPLIARIVMGGPAGACLCVSSPPILDRGSSAWRNRRRIGAFAGYEARKRLVNGLKVKDIMIAIPEDLVAIGLAYLLVSR